MRAFDMSPQHCAYYVFSCQFEEIQDTPTKTYTAKPTPCKKQPKNIPKRKKSNLKKNAYNQEVH